METFSLHLYVYAKYTHLSRWNSGLPVFQCCFSLLQRHQLSTYMIKFPENRNISPFPPWLIYFILFLLPPYFSEHSDAGRCAVLAQSLLSLLWRLQCQCLGGSTHRSPAKPVLIFFIILACFVVIEDPVVLNTYHI